MKEATKGAASEAFAHMLAVMAMLVIASILFYGRQLRVGGVLSSCRGGPRTGQAQNSRSRLGLSGPPPNDGSHRLRCCSSPDGAQRNQGYIQFHYPSLAKNGTSLPANRLKLALTSSPMARSFSPCAIMRKPSAQSTSRML